MPVLNQLSSVGKAARACAELATLHVRRWIVGIRRIDPTIAARGVVRIAGRRRTRSRRAVVKIKHLPIKRVGRGIGAKDVEKSIDIGQGLGLEFRAGQNYLKTNGSTSAYTLRIEKEEQFVLS